MGRSLGGGVMVDLAAADGARGLILGSTFMSLPEVAAKHVFWLPTKLLMRNRLDSLSKIGNYHSPLLQSHGDEDRLIPYKQGQRLSGLPGSPEASHERYLSVVVRELITLFHSGPSVVFDLSGLCPNPCDFPYPRITM